MICYCYSNHHTQHLLPCKQYSSSSWCGNSLISMFRSTC